MFKDVPVTSRLLAFVAFLCLSTALVVATESKATSRQGAWTRRAVGTMTGLRSVYFLDDMQGWAVGGAGILLATNDGGQTWQVKRRSS